MKPDKNTIELLILVYLDGNGEKSHRFTIIIFKFMTVTIQTSEVGDESSLIHSSNFGAVLQALLQ